MHAVSSRPLEEIITSSTFRLAGRYFWASAGAIRNVERHLLIARDEKETTVVTEHLEDIDVVELNPDRWTLLSIDCASPFYCAGFIAAISAPLRDAGIDILVVSTFTRDWVFVKESEAGLAKEILRAAGFQPG